MVFYPSRWRCEADSPQSPALLYFECGGLVSDDIIPVVQRMPGAGVPCDFCRCQLVSGARFIYRVQISGWNPLGVLECGRLLPFQVLNNLHSAEGASMLAHSKGFA